MIRSEERYLSLATFRRSGVAVETPVWFAERYGKLYVFTGGDSGKVKRLRHSRRARIAPCDARGKVRGGWSDASARIVSEPDTISAAYSVLRSKYGLQMRLVDALSRITGRYSKRVILEIEPSAAREAPASEEERRTTPSAG